MKLRWALIALAVIVLGAFVLWWGSDPGQPAPAAAAENAIRSPSPWQTRPAEPAPRAGPSVAALWQTADPAAITVEIESAKHRGLTQRHAMRYDAGALRAVDVGTALSIPMPDGSHGSARVTQRIEHANGDVSFVANVDDGGGSLVVTVGSAQVHITLTGSIGAYELSGDADSGWLVSSTELGPIGPQGYEDVLVVEPVTRAFAAPGGEPAQENQ